MPEEHFKHLVDTRQPPSDTRKHRTVQYSTVQCSTVHGMGAHQGCWVGFPHAAASWYSRALSGCRGGRPPPRPQRSPARGGEAPAARGSAPRAGTGPGRCHYGTAGRNAWLHTVAHQQDSEPVERVKAATFAERYRTLFLTEETIWNRRNHTRKIALHTLAS